MKIHNIALSFHGLSDVGVGQKSIDGFFSGSGGDELDGSNGRTGKKRSRDSTDDDEGRFSFVCDQCRKQIRLPSSVIHSFTEDVAYHQDDPHSERHRLLENLRSEHADYHFARSLAHAVSDTEESPVAKKKKTSGNGHGIGMGVQRMERRRKSNRRALRSISLLARGLLVERQRQGDMGEQGRTRSLYSCIYSHGRFSVSFIVNNFILSNLLGLSGHFQIEIIQISLWSY